VIFPDSTSASPSLLGLNCVPLRSLFPLSPIILYTPGDCRPPDTRPLALPGLDPCFPALGASHLIRTCTRQRFAMDVRATHVPSLPLDTLATTSVLNSKFLRLWASSLAQYSFSRVLATFFYPHVSPLFLHPCSALPFSSMLPHPLSDRGCSSPPQVPAITAQ